MSARSYRTPKTTTMPEQPDTRSLLAAISLLEMAEPTFTAQNLDSDIKFCVDTLRRVLSDYERGIRPEVLDRRRWRTRIN